MKDYHCLSCGLDCWSLTCPICGMTALLNYSAAFQKQTQGTPMQRKVEPIRPVTFISHESSYPVAAGAIVSMVARPQVEVIKPYKLFIELDVAKSFVINDIRVGNRSMFPMCQNLPATQFSHDDGHLIEVDPIMLAMDFLMMVTNISEAQRTFRASWACYKTENVQQFPRRPTRVRSLVLPPLAEDLEETVEVPASKIESVPASEKQEVPNFGWDPGYGD